MGFKLNLTKISPENTTIVVTMDFNVGFSWDDTKLINYQILILLCHININCFAWSRNVEFPVILYTISLVLQITHILRIH